LASERDEFARRLRESEAAVESLRDAARVQAAQRTAERDDLARRLRESEAAAEDLKRAAQTNDERLAAERAAELSADLPLDALGAPSLEPLLEPAWRKIVDSLEANIQTAYGHLRRLAGTSLPEGHRALLRLAAGGIVDVQDRLKLIACYFDDAGPVPGRGRISPVVERALSAWEPALRRRGVSVVRRIAVDLPEVLFETEALRVACYQLARNAYEALPRGGCLTVAAAVVEGSGDVSVTFSDTGGGFSEEARGSLFAPFSSTRRGHLGLGLALCRRILRRWGGDVEAANGPAGAAVSLRFPPAGGPLPTLTELPE